MSAYRLFYSSIQLLHILPSSLIRTLAYTPCRQSRLPRLSISGPKQCSISAAQWLPQPCMTMKLWSTTPTSRSSNRYYGGTILGTIQNAETFYDIVKSTRLPSYRGENCQTWVENVINGAVRESILGRSAIYQRYEPSLGGKYCF